MKELPISNCRFLYSRLGLKIGNWKSAIKNDLWLNTKKDLF